VLGAGSVVLQSFRFKVLLETYCLKKKPADTMNCLPFLGHKKWEAFYAYGS